MGRFLLRLGNGLFLTPGRPVLGVSAFRSPDTEVQAVIGFLRAIWVIKQEHETDKDGQRKDLNLLMGSFAPSMVANPAPVIDFSDQAGMPEKERQYWSIVQGDGLAIPFGGDDAT